MFDTIKQRFRNMGTIKTLCSRAEQIANAHGRTDPNAEDYLLSSLELPDGTARKAFARVHADPNRLSAAIDQQYKDALRNVGIAIRDDAAIAEDVTPVPPRKLPKAGPSGQALINALVHEIMVPEQKIDPAAPLLGAHVIIAATMRRLGVVARALRAMEVDPDELVQAAKAEIQAYRATP